MGETMTADSIYDEIVLLTTPEKIYLSPNRKGSELVTIDRVNHVIQVEANVGQVPVFASRKTTYGVVGLIHLLAGPCLIVVTGRQRVGCINRQDIWRMTAFELVPVPRSLTHLTEGQIRLDKDYKSMVEMVFSTPSFYFSYTYDITHTVQRLYNNPPDFLSSPIHLRADQRFVWNEALLKNFDKSGELSTYCLPIMMGFVSINTCVLNGRTFSYILLSRRSKQRAGMRLFVRGIDHKGHVANYVETEQIVETQSDRASFVQTRGSMPFYWHQWPNLKYKPRPTIIPNANHEEAFARHFESQVMEYGRQVMVNLVDQKGSEGALEAFYRNLVEKASNPNLRYEAFDFHHECSKMRWNRLTILTDRLALDQEQHGVMMLVKDGKPISQQEGVFRTNCIDCLDRTNVVQSMLARNSLTYVLQKFSMLRPGQRVEEQAGLESMFKSVWADNADYVSIQYSGTGALKTDFTRTGKRTRAGVLQDGLNSISRYYKNNFTQGYRQDAFDLVLGNYQVDPTEGVVSKSPLEATRDWKYFTFPLVFLVAMSMFFANLISPQEYTTGSLLSLLFWGSMVGVTFASILFNGKEYVDSPRLWIRPPSIIASP